MSDFEKLEAEGLAMHTPEFERQIAETMAERERDARRFSDAEVRRRAERRERIATELMPSVLDRWDNARWIGHSARRAIEWAETLINELDAAEARDREATK